MSQTPARVLGVTDLEIVNLSAINQYLYCSRRAALIHVEGIFIHNEHTAAGQIIHEQTDVPGYEKIKGVTLLRALPVWSAQLGISGKCDIVERHPGGSLVPVEFKKGRRRKFDNDEAQLCGQALCLEEMFGTEIPKGAIFHARSKRRREVVFDEKLRSLTKQAIAAVRGLMEKASVPQAVHKPQCSECSLFDYCLPEITCAPPKLTKLARDVFNVDV